MGRKVLWRRSIRIRLAILGCFGVLFVHGSGLNFVVMLLEMFPFGGARFLVGKVLLITVVNIILMELFMVRFFVMLSGARQGFPWQQFDRRTVRRSQ